MFESGLAPSSIVTYTAGITICHKLGNLTDPGNSFLVEKLLTAALKTKTTKDCRLPITKQILGTMLGHLSQVINKSYDNIIYRATFLLAFYAFLRIGEITISSVSADALKLVQIGDITMLGDSKGNYKAMKLCIRNWKSQIPGVPFTLTILAQPSRACPVLAIKNYLRIRGTYGGPLFTKQNKLSITRAQFSQALRQVIKKAGFDDSRIKGHNFRIGASTTAASLGFTEDQIQRMGRWRSDAVKKYIRITSFTIK